MQTPEQAQLAMRRCLACGQQTRLEGHVQLGDLGVFWQAVCTNPWCSRQVLLKREGRQEEMMRAAQTSPALKKEG